MMNPGNPYALVTGDFVTTGGMDRANHALASYLLRLGREVHLVGFRAEGDLLARPNARFQRVVKPFNSYALGLPLLRARGSSVANRVARAGGRVVVNGGNCPWGDVNWVHYVHAAWRPAAPGGVARGVKAALFRRAELRAERASLRAARVVIANSDRTRSVLLDRFGLPPERVRTLYYGVDPLQFFPANPAERAAARARLGWEDDRPTVAFVGALGDTRKGFDTLLNAWQRLGADSDWDGRLAVVGAGATLGVWRSEVARRGLSGSVEFMGFRRDVPGVLRACDALVSPTRYEAYGLNAHEALCCGLPAFVSAEAGVAERYPPALRDLLIPDPNDDADLASRLARWWGAGGAFREAVRDFSETLRWQTWDGMAAQFLGIVERQS